jgi:hypothetical protein
VRIVFRTRRRMLIVLLLILLLLAAGWWLIRRRTDSPSRSALATWFNNPASRAALITDLAAPCPGAPFRLPSVGFVGFLYADGSGPYTALNPHPGIDIFGNGKPGAIPVYAAYDGYLTRLPGWVSAVVIRIPHDPLDPARQIWTYYTHMASQSGDQSYISADFPPGTSERFVKQGTLLGYQGLYNGNGTRQIGLHLHFSVIQSDGDGSFRNETYFNNTLDPSPYFGMNLNATRNPTLPVRCGS